MTFPKRPFLAWLLLFSLIATAQTPDDFQGSWQGAIEIPNNPVDIAVVLHFAEDSWSGTIDIPAQGTMDVPLEAVEVEGGQISFVIAGAPGNPTFEGALNEGRIEGTFTQAGQEFPFTVERADAAAPLAAAQEAVYEDPEGRFTVPIPSNWTAEEQDGYGVLTSPDEGIKVYVLALEGEDIEAAIAEAWQRVRPGFDLEPEQILEQPATGGVERAVSISYVTPEDEIVDTLGQLFEGTVYILLLEGDLNALQQRGSQFEIILSGFTITELEEEDLAGQEPRPLTDEILGELEAYIEDALARFGVPGAAVAVVQGGQIVYAQGFGARSLETQEPITPETLMMIGSTAKTMTTMLMATLVDDGLMGWDTPVVDILPEFAVADPELTRQMTVEHLVCACTGVPRRDFEIFFNADVFSAEDIVASLRDFELFTGFGEAYQYSNQMVAAGGYVAAVAAGADYGSLYNGYVRAMQERVLDPIGLSYSTFSFDEVTASGNYATPHSFTADFAYEPIPLHVERVVTPIAPAGALWSNVIDMGRYLIAEMNEGVAPDGLRVVSAESLRHTWEPQVPVTAERSYGLGWFVDDYKGLTLLHHGGALAGFTSDLAFLPDVGIGISVITNGRRTNPFNEAVRMRLFELAFDLEQEYDQQAMFDLESTRRVVSDMLGELAEGVDPETVRPYVGRYTNEALGEITLALQDDRFVVDAGAFSTELLPRVGEEDIATYIGIHQPIVGQRFRLTEDEAGNPVVVFGEGVAEYTFERVE